MIADVTELPVERPRTREAACLGAAVLAMAAAGRHDSVAGAARSVYHPERRFEPEAALWTHYDLAFDRYVKLCNALCNGKDRDA
jgi:xylulokinase